MMSVTFLVLFSLVSIVSGYDTGAPVHLDGVCDAMNPQLGHQGYPRDNESPFLLQAYPPCWKPGSSVRLRIAVLPNAEFSYYEGFFVQARKSDGSSVAYGTFKPNGVNNKPAKCFGGTNNSITHVNSKIHNPGGKHLHFTSQNFTWSPEDADQKMSTPLEDLRFYYTVAKNKDNYWVKKYIVVKYNASCSGSDHRSTFPTVPPNVMSQTTTHSRVLPPFTSGAYALQTTSLLLVGLLWCVRLLS